MRLPHPSRTTLAFLAGAALAGGAVVVTVRPGASASASAGVRATCSASVDVVAGAAPASTFQSAFTVSSDRPFTDDRSGALREETFTATVVGDEIEMAYAKDTSQTEALELDVTVTFVGDRGLQSGRAVYHAKGQPDRVATYAVTCRR